MSSRREVIDKDTRSLAEASYEDVDKDCSSKRIVHVKQSVFKPATDDNPDSTRSSPLCVPAHSYDNDSSLFIWRTIKFEKGYTASYNTIIADRRLKQGVTLFVRDQTQIDTRDGKTDAWLVDIKADANTQQAWFATTPDHKLLRYNNGTLEFVLAD